MIYLLDTNICVHFLRGKFGLSNILAEVGFANCSISEITIAELIFGAENSSHTSKNLRAIEGFIEEMPVIPIYDSIYLYGKEKARLRKAGNMISDFDLLIACTAVKNELIMVTENIREFERITNIKLENWVIRNK